MLVDFSIRKKSSNFTPNLCIAKMVVEIIAKYLESNKRLVVPNLGTFIVKVASESVLFSAWLIDLYSRSITACRTTRSVN